ncbi:MAG: glycosyltransferase [bacterium]
MDLTILIITKNAANTLTRTLDSVRGLRSKIVVVDDYSSDKTLEIIQAYNCTIIRNHCYDFGEQRAFALEQVITEWTLVLDSDEVLTKNNIEEITNVIGDKKYDGYYLRFRNHLFGKKLMHGELHKKLVLFKTTQATSQKKLIHEQYNVSGLTSELESEVLHYSYRSVPQIVRKFLDYSIRQAKQYKEEKRHYGIRELLLNPLHMFYSRYILDEGYRDGVSRIILDCAFAKMEFLSYALIPFVKTKKRISIDCGSCNINGTVQSGIDRVIQGIYSHKTNNIDYYWFGFHNNSSHKLPTRLYSQIWLPLITLINRCDIFLGTGGTIPWILQFFSIKKILFLYDFGFFSTPEKYDSTAVRLQTQTNNSIKRADKIVVLHDVIYREFLYRYPQYSYKVNVIPAGADHLTAIKEEPVFIQDKKPVFLAVGVVKPVKRIDKIISVIGNTYCIIAGPHENKYAKTLSIGKAQNVQFIKNFNDGQLRWLYNHSDVLINASEHEGFCYPVLEALILGLPVVALDLPLFRSYQAYFSHLTLVKTEYEMRKALNNIDGKKYSVEKNHPYTWKLFNEKLALLWQPQLTQSPTDQKGAFIIVLHKTPSKEKKRLEKEINNLGLSSYAIYWIDNSTNDKGYAAGINEGIRKGLQDGCHYFFALNPDVSFRSISSHTLLAAAEMFDVWGYGMKQGNNMYYGGKIDIWRLSGGLISVKPLHRFASVDFVSGSVMGFSSAVIQRIGLWDESYFMYYEDVDYCMRAKKARFTVGIDTKIMYDHFEVSQQNKKKQKWIARSRWLFFWKYANWIQKIREIVRLPKTLKEV